MGQAWLGRMRRRPAPIGKSSCVRGGILRKGENAVLLIGARQDNRAVGEGLAVKAADQAVAVVVCLTSRAAVAGKARGEPQSKMTRRLSTWRAG